MAWLQRLFGLERPQANQQSQATRTQAAPQAAPQAANRTAQAPSNAAQASVPPERMGLNGEYDESGLAKRVALAFDDDNSIDDINTLYVAQTGTTVVLKGKVPDQQILGKMVSVARSVKGATAVDTSQVSVG
jgi:osmotically-inducible protein OsmY